MRRLTLLRHAKSSWEDPELDDFDRPLNPRGLRALPDMGFEGSHANPTMELITAMMTPTVRAQTEPLNRIGVCSTMPIRDWMACNEKSL